LSVALVGTVAVGSGLFLRPDLSFFSICLFMLPSTRLFHRVLAFDRFYRRPKVFHVSNPPPKLFLGFVSPLVRLDPHFIFRFCGRQSIAASFQFFFFVD